MKTLMRDWMPVFFVAIVTVAMVSTYFLYFR